MLLYKNRSLPFRDGWQSRAPSLSNLRLTNTTSGSSSPVVLDRTVPSSMTRLKKPLEEHLLKPPVEVTKSSTVASKARIVLGKRRETVVKATEEGQAGSSEGLHEKHGRDGLESDDARKGPKDDNVTSETHRHERHHRHQHEKKHRHRHQHHPHHSADPEGTPEQLAEAFFNPTPFNVWTPFTYVPDDMANQPVAERPPRKRDPTAPEKRTGVEGQIVTPGTDVATDTDEGSDGTAQPRGEFHDRTRQDMQPHIREAARWNAAEGAWQRRRGRGYGKMRMGTVRRPVGEIAHPFFKRLSAADSGIVVGQGKQGEMVV